jgi:hypothetical protein
MSIGTVAIIAGTVATFALSALTAGTGPAEAAKAARSGPIIRDHRASAGQASNPDAKVRSKHPCYYGCATVRDHRPADWQPKNTDAAVRDHRDPWVPKPRLP